MRLAVKCRLDYARPLPRAPSRWITVAADVTLAWPLFLIGSLYGQWFLSWYLLGHAPRPSADDPKYIIGASWMHPITTIALFGMLPAAGGALAFNTLHVLGNRVRGIRLAMRVIALPVLWLGMIALLRYDRQPVMEWWFD